VIDTNGCEVSGVGVVPDARPAVRMPTGFDPQDGPYQPVSNCSISYELLIFDRWGQLLYSGVEGWNGLFKGESMTAGVYTYYLNYEYALESGLQTDQIRGSFTLIQ